MTTSRITAEKTSPQALAPRERQVLEAAGKIAEPGEPVSPTELAANLGIKRNHVSLLIAKLKAKGHWHHPSPGRGRKAGQVSVVKPKAKTTTVKRDDDVIKTLETVVDLLKPFGEADRRRVLECARLILLPKG